MDTSRERGPNQTPVDCILKVTMPNFLIPATMDHYVVAGASLGGMVLDFLGGLFLAYELLGQKRGPLRMLLRVVLYTVIFSAGYCVAFGPVLGCLGGLGLGISLAVELRHAETPDPTCALQRMFTLALFRAGVLGVVTSYMTNRHFGIVFGLLSAVALLAAYQLHFAASDKQVLECCPQLSGKKFAGALIRGLFIAIAGAISGYLSGACELSRFGLNMGLTVGVVGVMVGTCSPFIEWYTDHLSDRLLGLLGVVLIGCGMLLQSLQYFVVFFDIALK